MRGIANTQLFAMYVTEWVTENVPHGQLLELMTQLDHLFPGNAIEVPESPPEDVDRPTTEAAPHQRFPDPGGARFCVYANPLLCAVQMPSTCCAWSWVQ